ncbi:MAG: hypothetical protein KGJ09_09305 [Candidatus Omnitrophica bacterium]|nr:hypothetical protein [Candidatus Omnitrophota bacterium]
MNHEENILIQDLATLVAWLAKRLASAHREKKADLELVDKARDFLKRKGLQGSILREKKKTTLTEDLRAIWEAGGKAWGEIEDPEAYLREIRGE